MPFTHIALQHVWQKQTQHIIMETSYHGGGGIMFGACFSITGPEHLTIMVSDQMQANTRCNGD